MSLGNIMYIAFGDVNPSVRRSFVISFPPQRRSIELSGLVRKILDLPILIVILIYSLMVL